MGGEEELKNNFPDAEACNCKQGILGEIPEKVKITWYRNSTEEEFKTIFGLSSERINLLKGKAKKIKVNSVSQNRCW